MTLAKDRWTEVTKSREYAEKEVIPKRIQNLFLVYGWSQG